MNNKFLDFLEFSRTNIEAQSALAGLQSVDQVVGVAAAYGYDLTLDDIKSFYENVASECSVDEISAYFEAEDVELSQEQLMAVSGGFISGGALLWGLGIAAIKFAVNLANNGWNVKKALGKGVDVKFKKKF